MDGLLMKYFVLRPKGNDIHATASRAAMRTYADRIQSENPKLAQEIHDWVSKEQHEIGL